MNLCVLRDSSSYLSSSRALFKWDVSVDVGCTHLIQFFVQSGHISTLRLRRIYRCRIQTCDRCTARPPCSHLDKSFGCFVRGLRSARLVSLFVVWVYVGWWWGVAHTVALWLGRSGVVFGNKSNVRNMPIEPGFKPLARPQSHLKISWDDI